MSSLCVKFKLYDPFYERYPAQAAMPTYNRGQTCLDYILLSTSLGKPTNIEYNPFYFIYDSDHRAMFIDIPIKQHFQLQNPMVNDSMREIGRVISYACGFSQAC